MPLHTIQGKEQFASANTTVLFMYTHTLRKRMTAILSALILLFSTLVIPTSAASKFTDVRDDDWFCHSVDRVLGTGMMIGTSDTTFEPLSDITGAQGITLLSRLHARITGRDAELSALYDPNAPWYQSFLDYASTHQMIDDTVGAILDRRMLTPLTRAELLYFFSRLPDSIWTEKNLVEDGAIPDVPVGAQFYDAIYRAYRAGIVIGMDDAGTFLHDKPISRAEVAAFVIRILYPEERFSITLKNPTTPPEAPTPKPDPPTPTQLTLYAADGTSITVSPADTDAYLALGWSKTPYQGKFDAETLLNAMPLNPVKTGYAPLDKMIDTLFAKIHTSSMTTYEKVLACYDYLVTTSTYGRSPVSGKYRSVYKSSPYIDPSPSTKTPMRGSLTGYSGYDYFYIALSAHELESYAIMYASEILDSKTGWCDHYSSAFAIMMRRLGLPAIPLYVNSRTGNQYAPHMTSMMIVGGVECYFDPQIEAVLVGNTGKNEHKRFCRPRAEMTKEYIVYGDDIAISYALFGAFSYDAAKMAKLPTP